jgi:exodeoxyribonuclease VII large subunit
MVAETFPEAFWVKAEIRQYSVASAGHCYMTLSESRGGRQVAEIRSIIWKWKFPTIAATFRQATGTDLKAGITVLVKVTLNFSELYGMSLYVEDIDPAFTLGEQALERKRAIERLTREGYMEMQKELCIPPIPYNLAIISSPTAAGLQDFLNHLKDNDYGFVFNPVLFDAAMQGDGASASVVAAFGRIAAAEEVAGRNFDAVLILRGGGSETDLACFDDYDMAVAIATCSSPVVTAIGHDKDHHIADMVANAYVKTPTALADLFINAYIAEDERIVALQERVEDGVRRRLDAQVEAVERLAGRVSRAVTGRFAAADRALQLLSSRISRGVLARSHAESTRLTEVRGRITRGLLAKSHQLSKGLEDRVSRLRFAAGSRQAMAASRVALVEARIAGADPREILSRGYVLVTGKDNRLLKSTSRVSVGDRIGVRFSDGHLRATVNEVARDKDERRKVSTA